MNTGAERSLVSRLNTPADADMAALCKEAAATISRLEKVLELLTQPITTHNEEEMSDFLKTREPQYPIEDYSLQQWWVKELEQIFVKSIDRRVTADMKRAALIALDFIKIAVTKFENDRNTIDLYQENFKSIMAAAAASNWMPPEYCMNDWVSDVCCFLRNRYPEQPVAVYDGVEFSRYVLRWTDAPLPVGTKLYAGIGKVVSEPTPAVKCELNGLSEESF